MLDYLGIFKKLNEEEIRYIVVGGLAVNLYGIPRMTYDIDLILDLEYESLGGGIPGMQYLFPLFKGRERLMGPNP